MSLDIDLRLAQGWTVLFGPSGSGKTTILRAIAGFLRADEGRISDGENLYFDSAKRVFVPPHLRRVRSAGQAGRLFPHMTALKNILYGSGRPSGPTDPADLAAQVMESFQIERLRDRYACDLSGGEQQRACVARALVSAITSDGPTRPLLLLDEPLSGLDLAARDTMVAALQRWTVEWKVPVVSVTHSLGEAFQLEAEIVRISDGRIAQQGTATMVLGDERRHLLGLLGDRQLPS
jgi:molybdate transport system ATP-binding protein